MLPCSDPPHAGVKDTGVLWTVPRGEGVLTVLVCTLKAPFGMERVTRIKSVWASYTKML